MGKHVKTLAARSCIFPPLPSGIPAEIHCRANNSLARSAGLRYVSGTTAPATVFARGG